MTTSENLPEPAAGATHPEAQAPQTPSADPAPLPQPEIRMRALVNGQ